MGNPKYEGFLSRIFAKRSPAPTAAEGEIQPRPTATRQAAIWADNRHISVLRLVNRVLSSRYCLIVTGYQDFLSALTIILDSAGELEGREPGSIRVVFGTNFETSRTIGGVERTVSEEARAHFLGARGLAVNDLADLRAILALDAIERGVITFRAYDADRAIKHLGRRPTMLHAKLFVSETCVLAGSANFSNAGMRGCGDAAQSGVHG